MVMRAMVSDVGQGTVEDRAVRPGRESGLDVSRPGSPGAVAGCGVERDGGDETTSTGQEEPRRGGTASLPVLLTVDDLAAILRCSPRTVHRLVERGRVPRPCRLGSLLRWTRAQVDEWVARGCPDCRGGIRRN
jgi:excisionase family DNA binding protein